MLLGDFVAPGTIRETSIHLETNWTSGYCQENVKLGGDYHGQ